MGPNNSESFQLPEPMPEQAQSAASTAETAPSGPELTAAPERDSQASSAAAPSLPSVPLPAPPVMPATDQSIAAPAQDNPAQASDDDRIEKDWVIKAKQIVENTRNDPYKQSEELSLFKADYMKKRYNRTIKVSK